MRLSVSAPAPAGCALIRDVRTWHGGTPNLSKDVRAIPSAGFLPPWYTPPRPGHWGAGQPKSDWDGKVLPHEVWQGMSEHAKMITAGIKAEPGADVTKAPWSPEADIPSLRREDHRETKIKTDGHTVHGHGLRVGKL